MQAFIVRPFGTRGGIDFDAVERELIQPALRHHGISGGTTGQILEAGNIREDMFQLLLAADLVVADVSLHNANVFYELGIRHALRPRRTFLIRARPTTPRAERTTEDEVPFDLRTDRYLEYNAAEPAAALDQLKMGLGQTLASDRQDSPVFRLLPDLVAQDRSRFLPVPVGFREDVDLAARAGQIGLLGLLAVEASGFAWAPEAYRVIGRAQFHLRAYTAARATWERLLSLDARDIEANLLLGTVYQRLGDLNASDQALQRALDQAQAAPPHRAEALSLLGRNVKERWRLSWKDLSGEQAARQALRSPYLLQAFDRYRQGFEEDLNSFYPGLNALSLLTIAVQLAKRFPELWGDRFSDDTEAARELGALEGQWQTLSGAVSSSLNAAKRRLERTRSEDRWVDISLADHRFLTTTRPALIARAYEAALDGVPGFQRDSALSQLALFDQLGLFPEKIASVTASFPPPSAPPARNAVPDRVVLFTGHMIDDPGRVPARFPAACEMAARDAIRRALDQERGRTTGITLAMASAASGGDILFHEVCAELGIPVRLLLPLPPDSFRNESVSPAGPAWEERFDQIVARFPSPACLARSKQLPRWLLGRAGYSAWQRADLWLVQEALAVGAPHFTLLALWDGTGGDGLGGTEHMIQVARQNGAATVILRTQQVFTDCLTGTSR